MSKLTLNIDDRVIDLAKRYATQRGTSVSRLVERYLDLLCRPAPIGQKASTPLLEELRAEFKGIRVDIRDYRRYLEDKYR